MEEVVGEVKEEGEKVEQEENKAEVEEVVEKEEEEQGKEREQEEQEEVVPMDGRGCNFMLPPSTLLLSFAI